MLRLAFSLTTTVNKRGRDCKAAILMSRDYSFFTHRNNEWLYYILASIKGHFGDQVIYLIFAFVSSCERERVVKIVFWDLPF
jgi:hypothetical protein